MYRCEKCLPERDFRGHVLTGDVIPSAVVGRCSYDRKPSGEIDAATGSNMLKWDETLIVVHRQYGIKFRIGLCGKEAVGRVRAKAKDAVGFRLGARKSVG